MTRTILTIIAMVLGLVGVVLAGGCGRTSGDESSVLVALFVLGFLGISAGLIGVVFKKKRDVNPKVRAIPEEKFVCRSCRKEVEHGDYVMVGRWHKTEHYNCDNPKLRPK